MSGDTVSGNVTLEAGDEAAPIELLALTPGQVFDMKDYSLAHIPGGTAEDPTKVEIYDGDPTGDGEKIDSVVIRDGSESVETGLNRDDFTNSVYVSLGAALDGTAELTIGGEITTT